MSERDDSQDLIAGTTAAAPAAVGDYPQTTKKEVIFRG
jgi:hypothetical protein